MATYYTWQPLNYESPMWDSFAEAGTGTAWTNPLNAESGTATYANVSPSLGNSSKRLAATKNFPAGSGTLANLIYGTSVVTSLTFLARLDGGAPGGGCNLHMSLDGTATPFSTEADYYKATSTQYSPWPTVDLVSLGTTALWDYLRGTYPLSVWVENATATGPCKIRYFSVSSLKWYNPGPSGSILLGGFH